MQKTTLHNSHYEKILATGEVRCIDDEIPFEIPDSWEWCRSGKYVKMKIGKTPARGVTDFWTNGVYPWVSISDMSEYGVVSETKEKVSEIAVQNEFGAISPRGTLLMSFKLTMGRTSILDIDAYHNETIISIYPYIDTESITRNYLFYILPFISNLGESKDAIKGKTLNSKSLYKMLLPIPPLNEQKYIVEKLDLVIEQVEQYDLYKTELDQLNTDIYSLLKKSILQEAIQGRLVPQDPTDEPADKLLERIRNEKQTLVKQGKLKAKDIIDSTIFRGADNKYYEKIGDKCVEIHTDFEFPTNWMVVRLADICRLIDGERKQGKYICLDAKFLRGKSVGDYLDKGKFVVKGDNIILVDGENSGEVFLVPCDGYMGSTFKQLWVSGEMYLPYVLYFIQFYKDHLRNSKKGAAIPHLNKDIFYNLVIGIPSINEQKRIANKVAELYSRL